MFPKLNRPYQRAAIWAAVIAGPTFLMYRYLRRVAWDFPAQHHTIIGDVAATVSTIVMFPGAMLEAFRAMLFAHGGGHNMNDNSLLIPIGSWGFWFLVFAPVFRWCARRAEEKG